MHQDESPPMIENQHEMSYSNYDYDYNSTNEYFGIDICIKTNAVQFATAITPVIFIIIVLFSCVGNTLVVWVLVKYENLKSLTNTFLLNLALSDLIFTFGLPFWAYYYMYGWTLGDPACKAVSFVFYTGYYSSIISWRFDHSPLHGRGSSHVGGHVEEESCTAMWHQ